MMIKRSILAAVALFCLLPGSAYAGTVTINPHDTAIAYGASWDGLPPGVFDSVLTGLDYDGDISLTLVNGSPGGTESWFGSSFATIILEEIAGYKNATSFGWYDTANPASYGQLFSGPDGIGATAARTFDQAINFGFYIDPNGSLGRLYSEHDLNPGNQYQVVIFAIDQFAGQYILGWEDLALNGSTDRDYQDMILRLTVASVSEPASVVLMMFGLAVLYRRNASRKRPGY